jgi:hypothetical protein
MRASAEREELRDCVRVRKEFEAGLQASIRARQRTGVTPQELEDRHAFYDLEDKKRERREIAIIVLCWIVFAGSLFALCWSGLRAQ